MTDRQNPDAPSAEGIQAVGGGVMDRRPVVIGITSRDSPSPLRPSPWRPGRFMVFTKAALSFL